MMAGEQHLLSGNVLLVEDNALIAMEAEELLLSMGAQQCHIAANLEQAREILRQVPLTFAMLDYKLGEETSESVGDDLAAAGVPFIVASGYASMPESGEGFRSVPIVPKPYAREDIERAILQCRRDS